MARSIMIQGTASSVGKSIVTAGLCRIFAQDGYKVAPFKSQNMALNSFVTKEGGEIGRAQAMQAGAAGVEPSILMNPILLKPNSETVNQIIINGKYLRNMDAKEYLNYKPEAINVVRTTFAKLSKRYEVIVIEGAGGPLEINLDGNDIANMVMAEIADCPVILVADIDKGGAFASIAGTLLLLSEEQKRRVRGVIINKFRGDKEFLKPGIEKLEKVIGVPVLGVLPYSRINLEDEGSVTDIFVRNKPAAEINISVIRLPRISNVSDFDIFEMFDDVSLTYAFGPEYITHPDLIIIPGSKNTIEDMRFVRSSGIEKKILDFHKRGGIVFGICGGYQMLGTIIEGTKKKDGSITEVEGMGLLDMRTTMVDGKITRQTVGKILYGKGILKGLKGTLINGYEIHHGISTALDANNTFAETYSGVDGIVSANIIGTYIHGIFDNTVFTRGLLNNIRKRKGLEPLPAETTFQEAREKEFDRLADMLRQNTDLKKIYGILRNSE